MSLDLLEEGARRLAAKDPAYVSGNTESGGCETGFSRLHTPGEVDVTHVAASCT